MKALKRAWEIDGSELEIGKDIIGKGSYGVVYRGQFHNIDVAVKKIYTEARDNHSLRAGKREQEFEQEIEIMQTMRHPNIVVFFGCGRGSDGSRFLVTELLTNGSLRTVLSDTSRSITWQQRLRFALDTARGMDYIHRLHKMHRDLKSGE